MPTAVIRLSIALITLAFFCTAASAQDTFSSLEERMTGREYMETGLHKLNEEELAALNEWIRKRSLTMEEARELNQQRGQQQGGRASAQTDRRGLPDSNDNERPIKSRIVGTYSGWEGDTVFELENGMVWEQAENGTHYVSPMESPAVEIRPGLLGTWQLIVEGQNRRLKVERIK